MNGLCLQGSEAVDTQALFTIYQLEAKAVPSIFARAAHKDQEIVKCGMAEATMISK